jgi:lipopolysaccharide export LptBFGC system permease protein LptF
MDGFEFSAAEDRLIEDLGKKMRSVALAFIVLGLLCFALAALALAFAPVEHPRDFVETMVVACTGIIYLILGIWQEVSSIVVF